MAYSDSKVVEMERLARHIGIEAAALQLKVKEKSVRRACQLFDKRELGASPMKAKRQYADAKATTDYYEGFKHKASHVTVWDENGEPYDAPVELYGKSELVECIPAMRAGNIEQMRDLVEAPERAKRLIAREAHLKRYAPPKTNGSRVLCIGDIHAPFDLDSYFDFCCSIYDRYNCDKVVFMGDVVDNHYSSYHEADPDGMVAGRELDLAIERLERWNNQWPEADVLIGNHDRIVARKAQTAGIANRWIRGYADALDTPDWNFTERTVIDGVQYIHGEGGTARTKSRKDLMSTVQGHLHTQAYTEWTVGANYKIFGCQVGCGIDHESYAMAYAKNFGKPAIGCAVVINGKTCINELMEL